MCNDEWHKHYGFAALTALVMYIILTMHYTFTDITSLSDRFIQLICLSVGFLFGVYMFNPDTFTPSASQNNWGPLKFIWGNRLYRFAHHGIVSHSPLIWVLIPIITYRYNPIYSIGIIKISIFIFTAGISTNAAVHLTCDLVQVITPRPIRKLLGF